jgi:hypothetical protein
VKTTYLGLSDKRRCPNRQYSIIQHLARRTSINKARQGLSLKRYVFSRKAQILAAVALPNETDYDF